MSGITNCSITIGTNDFVVYPFNNVFKFNFKPVVTTLINQNGFKDSILPDLSGGDFIFEDESLQLTINPEFFCYNSTTGETINKEYKFLKCVEQLPFYNQRVSAGNDIKVLLPSSNGFDYHLTYFEGYPSDFAIQGLESGYTFNIKNSNSVIVLNGLNLKNEIKEINHVIVYNWSPNCKSKICPSLSLIQNNCEELGFELFVVAEYYDDFMMSKNYSIKNSLLGIDTKYYKCDLTSFYFNRFYNDLTDKKYNSKSKHRFLYFFKGDFIKSFDSFDELILN